MLPHTETILDSSQDGSGWGHPARSGLEEPGLCTRSRSSYHVCNIYLLSMQYYYCYVLSCMKGREGKDLGKLLLLSNQEE